MDPQHPTSLPDSSIPQIIEALEAIHNPRSSNQVRHDATAFLETAKQSPDALAHGFHLAADDPTRATILRHFGLSMMIFYLKYVYSGGSENTLREYVLKLTESLREQDPPFLRNKVAQLWVEVAKRIWGGSYWQDMDEQLVRLWESGQNVYIEFALIVMEALAEDIFNQEDYIAGLRPDLGSAFARICITQDLVDQHYKDGDELSGLRYGQDGWLLRICVYLKTCLDRLSNQDSQAHSLAMKTFATLQSICPWIPPKSLATANTPETIGYALMVGDTQIRTSATEALCCIFARMNVESDDMKKLLEPLFSRESLQLLRDAFQWAGTDIPDEDEQKYAFAKKLSELLTCLGSWVEINPAILQNSGNVSLFFQLFLDASKHPSLLLSLPLLQVWLKLLKNKTGDFTESVEAFIGSLLELCSSRSIRYDVLPEDTNEPTLAFLAYDCDNTNQRDLILQQYRTACASIIEQIVRKVPIEALRHILSEAVSFYQNLEHQPFDPATYSRASELALRSDAHFATVDSSVRGCLKWMAIYVDSTSEVSKAVDQKAKEIRQSLSDYCQTVMSLQTRDPDIKKKFVAQAVSITCKISPNGSPVALPMLDAILSIRTDKSPGSSHYTEMSKELIETCAYAAQRLATVFADQFLPLYDNLEQRIQVIIAEEGDDLQPAYFAFLVMIIHRASNLDTDARKEKLRQMVLPVKAAWENAELSNAASSYEAFCSLLGWDQLPQFIAGHGFPQSKDWAEKQLNEEGKQFQTDLLRRNEIVPIKLTKAILKATTDKVDEGSPVFNIACSLWQEVMPAILPNILKMLNHATVFHDSSRWGNLPPDLKACMTRLLQDRFWQSGISAESRDAFVSRVTNSRHSFEGFGSTVRRTIRQIRVGSCDILLYFSKLGEAFFAIPDLASPLSDALYDGSQALTAHHFSVLVTFSSQLLNACPRHLNRQFLPPLIAKLFTHLRYKIESEWDAINKRTEEASADDNLDDEMKNQSILRSMTYNACYLFYHLVRDPIPHSSGRHGTSSSLRPSRSLRQSSSVPILGDNSSNADSNDEDSISTIILSSPETLEPLLLFAATTIRVRDTHSLSAVLNALRDVIPHITDHLPADAATSVTTFLCTDLLQAAITSLHEPYFVDSQRDLSSLITLLVHLSPSSCATVFSSLPGLSQQPDRVRAAVEKVCASQPGGRSGRAVVLELLEQIRGVSIHEMGKIGMPKAKKTRNVVNMEQTSGINDDGLDGVAGLLGGE